MENGTEFNWSEKKESVQSENVASRSSSVNSFERHMTSESTTKQDSKTVDDNGYNRGNPIAALLSSKELPSWATRQTAPVLPNNSHVIAECQGCIKGNGTAHTCDIKEDLIHSTSDLPPGTYPSQKQAPMPQMPINPYAWPESPDLGPPPYRPPPIPGRRRDPRYYVYHGYEGPFYDEYDEDYSQYHHLEGPGGQFTNENPRVAHPNSAYMAHPNLAHGYGAHDPGYVRSRQMEHIPLHHRHSMAKFPHGPVPLDQSLAAGEWYSKSLQNCSLNETFQAYPEIRVDVPRSRGDWPPRETERTVAVPSMSTENVFRSPSGNENRSDPAAALNLERSGEFARTVGAGEGKQITGSNDEAKTIREQTEPVVLRETKVDLTEKLVRATIIVPSELTKPANKSINSNKISKGVSQIPDKIESIDNNNDFAAMNKQHASDQTTNALNKCDDIASNNEPASEEVKKTIREQKFGTTEDAKDANAVQNDLEKAPRPTRKSPCAFTIDMSSTDIPSISKLPPNLAKRAAKFPRKAMTKDTKQEALYQTQITPASTPSTQRKKTTIDLRSIRKSSEEKEHSSNPTSKFLKSEAKVTNTVEDDYDDFDDDDDDDLDSYREKYNYTKSNALTDENLSAEKSYSSNQGSYKFPGIGLRTTALATPTTSPATLRRQRGEKVSRKFDRGDELAKPERENWMKCSLENPSRNSTVLSRSFQNRKQNKQNRKMAQFDSSDGEVSDADTYTIKAAEPSAEALAARQKIDLLFRVGLDNRNDYDDDDDDDDDNDETGRDMPPSTTTKMDVKSSKLEVKLREFLNSDNPIVQGAIRSIKVEGDASTTDRHTNTSGTSSKSTDSQDTKRNSPAFLQDSDDVICLSHESSKEFRKPSAGTSGASTTSGAALVTTSRTSSSSNKRVLPHVPTGGNDLGDADSLVSKSVSSRSQSSESDKGFFEVLSSDSPLLTRPERKLVGKNEDQAAADRTRKPGSEGHFEIIGDSPGLRNLEGGNPQDFVEQTGGIQRNSIVRRSWNKICSTMTSKAPPGELGKILPGRSEDKNDRNVSPCEGNVGENKAATHKRVGQLRSLPRFDENSYFDENDIETSGENENYDSVRSSKVRPWLDGTAKSEGQRKVNEEACPSSSSVRPSVRSDGRRLPPSPSKSVFRTLSDFSPRQPRASIATRGPRKESSFDAGSDAAGSSQASGSTPQNYGSRFNARLSSSRRQRVPEANRETRPPLSSSHQWNNPSRTPASGCAEGLPLTKTPEGRQRSLSRPPLSRGDQTRHSLRLPRHSSFDSHSSDVSRGDRVRSSLRNRRLLETPKPEKPAELAEGRIKRSKSASTSLRNKNSDPENPKLQAYHDRMKYDPKKSIMEAKKGNRLSAGSRSDDTDGSNEESLGSQPPASRRPIFASSGKTPLSATVGGPTGSGFRSTTRSRTTRSRTGCDDPQNCSTTSSDLDTSLRERAETQGSPTPDSIRNVSEEIKQMLQQLSRKMRVRPQSTKANVSKQTSVPADKPELKDLLSTLVEVKQVLKFQLHS